VIEKLPLRFFLQAMAKGVGTSDLYASNDDMLLIEMEA